MSLFFMNVSTVGCMFHIKMVALFRPLVLIFSLSLTPTHVRTHTQACARTQTHTRAHPRARARTYTHTHTCEDFVLLYWKLCCWVKMKTASLFTSEAENSKQMFLICCLLLRFFGVILEQRYHFCIRIPPKTFATLSFT
jgi:hypothetical protein